MIFQVHNIVFKENHILLPQRCCTRTRDGQTPRHSANIKVLSSTIPNDTRVAKPSNRTSSASRILSQVQFISVKIELENAIHLSSLRQREGLLVRHVAHDLSRGSRCAISILISGDNCHINMAIRRKKTVGRTKHSILANFGMDA